MASSPLVLTSLRIFFTIFTLLEKLDFLFREIKSKSFKKLFLLNFITFILNLVLWFIIGLPCFSKVL
ncbi:MAG: hypothetical protein ACKPKO_63225 [Candidatus Fonsibacter sp.]